MYSLKVINLFELISGHVQQDTHHDGTENVNEKKIDAANKSNSRSVGPPADSSAVEPVVAKPTASTNSKKGGGGEVRLVTLVLIQ